jgi:VWFA-related protein
MNFLPTIACALICLATNVQAQQSAPSPSPTPAPRSTEKQETIRILTEEVRIPIFAFDEYGHFDPMVGADDLLVLEDGVPQQVRSVQRIPASVLLVLGMGSDLNEAMRTNLTRDVALQLVSKLHEGDQIAVLQVTSNVELLQEWTNDKLELIRVLGSDLRPGKLQSGRGTRLALALSRAATESLKQVGNRHVVIIGDGVDIPAWADSRELMKALDPNSADAKKASAALTQAIRELTDAQAAVHIISYREVQELYETDKPRKHGSADVTSGFRFDPAKKRLQNAYARAMQKSEERLTSLAEETGGRLVVPTSKEEIIAEGEEVARDIGAQFVITYKPKRPLATAPKDEYRKLNVSPRRIGLRLRTRRGYFVTSVSERTPSKVPDERRGSELRPLPHELFD